MDDVLQRRRGIKGRAATADFKIVNEWTSEESFWVDAPAAASRSFVPATDASDGVHDGAAFGRRVAGLALVCAILFGLATLVGFAAETYAATPTAAAPAATLAPPSPTHLVRTPGTLVEIPAAVPHEAGDMVDSRIVPDLRRLAARYPIFVTDGYSGPLPDGSTSAATNATPPPPTI